MDDQIARRTPAPLAIRERLADQVADLTRQLADVSVERSRVEVELRAAKEAAEAANRAKDRFLAVLSHELRTPLGPVLALVGALERQELPPGVQDDLAVIRRSVQLEARLIDDLLDLTRIAHGKLRLTMQPIDVHKKVHSVLQICGPQIEEKRLNISLSLNAGRRSMMGDPARIQQILWNILGNAIKFTPEGGAISIRSWNETDDCIKLEITDSGMGIAPDMLPRLFDPFEQDGKTTRAHTGGLGLGLAITRTLADLHGGKVTASSEGKGKGATFTIELPLLADGQASPVSPVAQDQSQIANRKSQISLCILLVEDHRDTAWAMSRLLRGSGHEVLVAGTVSKALELSDSHPFDLLISDIGLPDGTGLDVMRGIRAKRPLKGIVLSGYGMEEDVRQSEEAGFAAHLTKPVNLYELESAIKRICQ